MIDVDNGGEKRLAAWRNIEPINQHGFHPRSREELVEAVEEPLREAVGALYDKNVETLQSSCSASSMADGAFIILNGSTLSPANLRIAEAYLHVRKSPAPARGGDVIGLFFPIGPADHPFDISRRATTLAEQFEVQPFSWVRTWSLQDALRIFKKDDPYLSDSEKEGFIRTLEEDGYYFDPLSQRVYLSREHFEKAKSFPK